MQRRHTHMHLHMQKLIYAYKCAYVCVCVCVQPCSYASVCITTMGLLFALLTGIRIFILAHLLGCSLVWADDYG